MTKIQLTIQELNKELQVQIDLLKNLINDYDKGNKQISKVIATHIRILLHDTKNSSSLLGQLSLKSKLFYSTCDLKQKPSNSGGCLRIIGLLASPGSGGYYPYLDGVVPDVPHWITFDEFWKEEIVFSDNLGGQFTRKDIVLYVSDQGGGAHVDSEVDEKFYNLIKRNSAGWLQRTRNGESNPIDFVEMANIRQIAHEVLKTLIPNYTCKNIHSKPGIIFYGLRKNDD